MVLTRIGTAALMATLVVGARGQGPGDVEVVEGVPEGFEVVRLTSPDDYGIHSRPDINDRGDVVWSLGLPQENLSNIFMYADGRVVRITDDTTFDADPVVNVHRNMAWVRADVSTGPYDLVIREGNEFTVITGVDVSGLPDISDSGLVVWQHDYEGDSTHVELCLRDGERVIALTDNGLSNQSQRVNYWGDVAWAMFDFDVSPYTADVMVRIDDSSVTLSPGDDQGGGPDLNDHGEVLWVRRSGGLVLWDGESNTVVSEDGNFANINNNHNIGFARLKVPTTGFKSPWVRFGAVEYALPNLGLSVAWMNMNDRDELVWRGLDFEQGATAVVILRRAAPKGDFNADCRIDMMDLAAFQWCAGGAAEVHDGALLGTCDRGDFDGDLDVDLEDFAMFQDAFTGVEGTFAPCNP